jgi:hypothetical protein
VLDQAAGGTSNASAPTCDDTTRGGLYFNTDLNLIQACQGASGSATWGTLGATTLQGAYDASVAAAGNSNPVGIVTNSTNGNGFYIQANTGKDVSNLFAVKNAGGGTTLLNVDSTGSGLITLGTALKLNVTSSNALSYLTPAGSSVYTAISIPVYNPGLYGQILAMGLPSTADTTSRVISLFDARTSAHQPTLAVFSPNESNLVGFSWDGSNTNAYVKTTGSTLVLQAGGTDLLTATSTGVTVNTGNLTVSSGNATITSGNLTVTAGSLITAGTTRLSSAGQLQNVYFGAASGTGHAGALVTGTNGAISLATSASSGYCLKWNSTTSAPSFQDCSGGSASWGFSGNSISSGDFLGTTNAQDLVLKTNTGGGTYGQLIISGGSSSGTTSVRGGSGGGNVFQVQNSSGSSNLFYVSTNSGIRGTGFRGSVGGTQACFGGTPNGSTDVEIGGCSSSKAYKHGITALGASDYDSILGEVQSTQIFHYYHNTDSPNYQRTGVISEYMPQELTQLDQYGNPTPDWFSVYGYLWAGERALADRTDSLKVEQQNLDSLVNGALAGQASLSSQMDQMTSVLGISGSAIQPHSINTTSLNVSGNITGGSLTVTGAATVVSLHVTGDTTIDGTLTVGSVVTADITINGHVITAGNAPVATAAVAAGTGATVSVDGNDTAGTITVTTGADGIAAGDLADIAFSKVYAKAPRIIMSGQDDNSVNARIFPSGKTSGGFSLSAGQALSPSTTYTFDYFIAQ